MENTDLLSDPPQPEFVKETFLFLGNLLGFNLDSRRLMANAILNALQRPLKNREGDFNRWTISAAHAF
jgi:hypothetical protein